MRPILASTLACALVSTCAVVSTPGSAVAAAGVARCAMPDGTFAYTNVACSGLGGSHAALPAEVQNRIRGERRREAQLTGASLHPDGLLATAPLRDSRRPQAQGCATTPQQLAIDLRTAMAGGDVNRIAESFDWAGMSHGRAMRMMTHIERLGGVSLVDAEYFGSTLDGGPQADAGGTLQVVLQGEGMDKVTDFSVRRNSGCYFLQHSWAV